MSDFRAIHPSLVQRLVWLIAVPLGSAFVPWVVLIVGNDSESPSLFWLWLVVLSPLSGALAALAYASGAPLPTRRWPLVPYLLVATMFAGLLLDLMTPNEYRDGLEGIPVLILGFCQPFLALLGGIVSFAWVPRR